MKEEVENRTVNLAVQTIKLTFRTVYAVWKKGMEELKQKAAEKATPDEAVHGR